jgi:hypothetical protein
VHNVALPGIMPLMKRHESRYRGWEIRITTEAGRKVLGHAAGAEAPCKLIMSGGWVELPVLKDLKRQIDTFEDAEAWPEAPRDLDS